MKDNPEAQELIGTESGDRSEILGTESKDFDMVVATNIHNLFPEDSATRDIKIVVASVFRSRKDVANDFGLSVTTIGAILSKYRKQYDAVLSLNKEIVKTAAESIQFSCLNEIAWGLKQWRQHTVPEKIKASDLKSIAEIAKIMAVVKVSSEDSVDHKRDLRIESARGANLIRSIGSGEIKEEGQKRSLIHE